MSSAKKEYLKGKNALTVSLFVVWCVTLFVAFSTGIPHSIETIAEHFSTLNAKDGVILVIMPIITLILSGFLPAATKAQLVFWRIRNALPGHRAFTVISERDPRIDTKELASRLGEMTTDESEQNSRWYSLYRKVDDTVTVKEVHKKFLLARDLAVYALAFCSFGGVSLLFASPSVGTAAVYGAVMFIHYLLLAVAAQNYGRGLVSNAIVEYLALDSSET